MDKLFLDEGKNDTRNTFETRISNTGLKTNRTDGERGT